MFTNHKSFSGKSLAEISSLLRYQIIQMCHDSKSAHLGSSLSCVDILSTLYFQVLNVRADMPDWSERDIFILSKGHAAVALYATLAAKGYFPYAWLKQYNKDGGVLAEHPPASGISGVEAATGSLGHGLPIATGEALAIRMRRQNRRVFCLISDGETNEGSVWEAALFAGAHQLSNLIVFLDYNKWQATGRSDEVLNTTAHEDKWRAFGWDVEMINGHDFEQIVASSQNRSSKPKLIIADTVKGKGVSFMEDDNNWHYRFPTYEEVQIAREELGI
ncbi:transketolase [Alphaproteobacteria bacterium]|nr:transketolase [Alphaproteobacteria bacterium]